MPEIKTFERTIGGRNLVIENGRMAGQANGAVTVRYGDTVVLVTAVIAKEPRPGVDFLPLTIDVEERMYAAGRIPGGFIRREGRPSEQATLAARLADRPLRPLLPKSWRREIQIIVTVLTADQENDPDVLGVIGASCALGISEMPFDGPLSAVRVGHIDGEFVINPTHSQLENSTLDVVVASTRSAVTMLEAGANEAPEDLMFEAIRFGHQANQEIIAIQDEIIAAVGKAKWTIEAPVVNPELMDKVSSIIDGKLAEAFYQADKARRQENLDKVKAELLEALNEDEYDSGDIMAAWDKKIRQLVRSTILDKKERVSGRGIEEIRELSAEVGVLPRVHGSALFSRGQTQILNVVTLGSLQMEQKLDNISPETSKRYIHHYNFPPYSVGETKRIGTGRREIGHGALAERALLPVVPSEAEFPYALRLVSEAVSSNGSTSMASACASSLSLMDAGVPIKKPVAGISIGLITDDTNPDRFVTLTDIEGLEDNYGDMDFKVAGTRDGITAIQLDMKLKGITFAVIEQTLAQARRAREVILEVMNKAIAQSRAELSPYAPRMYKLKIDPGKIGAVIGPGGRVIRSIIEETKTTIDIEDDGTVIIGASDGESAKKAIAIIEGMTKDIEPDSIYTGKVSRIMSFGAFVEILPGKEGMVHISELANRRVDKVEDVLKIGDTVTVKVIEIDSQGRINLSIRALLPPPTEEEREAMRNQPPPQGGFRRSAPGAPMDRSDRPRFRR
ncbi:polyribonucleotide nucleotidyltransferase [Dehalogenimonas lykanthroporepellens BL-DC-9]|nr:polyribonucleotide nucleotidyltransferase [Dehalogenimonas lykanthroporepellens BL-DC-9]